MRVCRCDGQSRAVLSVTAGTVHSYWGTSQINQSWELVPGF